MKQEQISDALNYPPDEVIYDPDRDNYGYDFAKMEALLREVAGRL